MAIALGFSLYLWDGDTGQAEQPSDIGYEDTLITSVCWAEKGRFLAVGLSNGSIQVCTFNISKLYLMLFIVVIRC